MTTQTETAKINPLHRDITDAEWDAMIGAAPQMREVLRDHIQPWLEIIVDADPEDAHPAQLLDLVRAAVSEATPPRPRKITGRSALRVGDVGGKEF